MTLEDHAGDIVAKARTALGVSVGEAAALAGMEVRAYQRFEQTGLGSPLPRFDQLAARLELHGGRLAAIASGWLPEPRDLSQWRELRQVVTVAGMAVNCYLIWDAATREAALFDTGWEAQPVFELIGEQELQLRHVFITHGHHDHIAALDTVRQRFPRAKLHDGPPRASAGSADRSSVFVQLGSLRIASRRTPGHTEDGTTYVISDWPGDAPPVAVVGDALFAGSMGRVGGAAFRGAKQAVREQILSLPPRALICPGHGPVTTAGEEVANNPFLG